MRIRFVPQLAPVDADDRRRLIAAEKDQSMRIQRIADLLSPPKVAAQQRMPERRRHVDAKRRNALRRQSRTPQRRRRPTADARSPPPSPSTNFAVVMRVSWLILQ